MKKYKNMPSSEKTEIKKVLTMNKNQPDAQ
jgi:hypothetical protein